MRAPLERRFQAGERFALSDTVQLG
jgi:hypothetical protein